MRKVCSTPGTSVAKTRTASTLSPAASKVRFNSHMFLFIIGRIKGIALSFRSHTFLFIAYPV